VKREAPEGVTSAIADTTREPDGPPRIVQVAHGPDGVIAVGSDGRAYELHEKFSDHGYSRTPRCLWWEPLPSLSVTEQPKEAP
jgi:hypothetical protein